MINVCESEKWVKHVFGSKKQSTKNLKHEKLIPALRCYEIKQLFGTNKFILYYVNIKITYLKIVFYQIFFAGFWFDSFLDT
jgi:hypothetical protein